nr:hypothetical protein [Tanacetum cinerariifolium]
MAVGDELSLSVVTVVGGVREMAIKSNFELPHARGFGFKSRREGFPSGAKKKWGLSSKAKVRVLHIAQLDVTVSSNN